MSWWQKPENGVLIHGAAQILAILLSALIGYVADSSDPFKLGGPTLGLISTIGQTLIAYFRNLGMATTTASQIVTTGRAGGDAVIVPSSGKA